MSSPVFLPQLDPRLDPRLDDAARQQALDPSRSFTVRAPAGSGKTELLIQRFLRMLATVEKPESIVAITFTRKAAGEMLGRVLDALRGAQTGVPATEPHQEVTRGLALAALARDRELGWDLLHHPGRLRVQTIDSLCMAITGEMPWLARLGGMPRIEEEANALYDEAARLTLLDESPDYADALTVLLRHLDNKAAHARRLIASMLARRDQWAELAVQEERTERHALEHALARSVAKCLARADRQVPHDLKEPWAREAKLRRWPGPEDVSAWKKLVETVLTQSNEWRKRFPANLDRQRMGPLLDVLKEVRKLPEPYYRPEHWEVLRALLRSLRLALGQLRMVFRERRVIDFVELGIAARDALGKPDSPTEVAFRMDSRIDHLLVDEFQDTSRGQFTLLTQLTSGWEPGDGRTLFLVGDPMQSIYRFRQAEVGLFLEAEEHGIGDLPLERLELRLNRRSRPTIVDRVNALFSRSFPTGNDTETGAVSYTASRAAQEEDGGEVTFDGFFKDEEQQEAECVVRRIQQARTKDPGGTVAILVRARTHLFAITEALKANGLRFQAVDIDPLGSRPAVQDLLTLTRALLDVRDRIAWLAILRAPWCGLSLADLEALAHGDTRQPLADRLKELSSLTADGQIRAARVRDVIEEAFAEQGRWPLRRWVERVWLRLGGPAGLTGDPGALADTAAYLDLLESEQSGADIRDFSLFRERVAKLFAPPETSADIWLKVMTIHKAKGLEFDTVIVPGLGRPARIEDEPLVLFHEWKEGREFECLLAPIDETGAEKDALYSYLRSIDTRKENFERARQLYVGATRAKKRLHLMGHARYHKDGEIRPDSRSMLADLWDGLTLEERATFRRDAQTEQPATVGARSQSLRRLPEPWRLPELPSSVTWEHAQRPLAEPHEPSFEWVGESLRRTGTVVHALLQRMNSPDDALPGLSLIRKMLAHAGVTAADLDVMARRVEQSLSRTQSSQKGRWILAAHPEAQAEYAVSGVVDGVVGNNVVGNNVVGNNEVVRGLIDRTFIDAGVRWIIDFKTSTHEGGNLEAFLDEQQRRYRDQMERYARILAPLGHPVRLGLYFPLLDEWREWAPGQVLR